MKQTDTESYDERLAYLEPKFLTVEQLESAIKQEKNPNTIQFLERFKERFLNRPPEVIKLLKEIKSSDQTDQQVELPAPFSSNTSNHLLNEAITKRRSINTMPSIESFDEFIPESAKNNTDFVKSASCSDSVKVETAPDILEQGAALYRQRNAIYADSYKLQGEVMQKLFPSGIKCENVSDYNRLTVISTIISKLIRYSQNFSTGGHADSSLDSMVYWSMLHELDNEFRK